MSVFIGEKNKRVELAERKDATNPNLLLNSRDFSANWIIDNAAVTSDSYNGGKVVSVHANGDGSTDVRQQVQTSPSQAFTWSVYAKVDNAGDKLHTELFGGGGRTDQALTTDWNRYTFQGISDPTNCTLYFWGVSGNKGDIYIALPKLEIGNTATPWCPAYDDYASNSGFNSLQNTIQAQQPKRFSENSKPDTNNDFVITFNDSSESKTRLRDAFYSMVPDGAPTHNNVFRGKNLGALDATHIANIKNGTFRDMFIGDYFSINGSNYVIAGINYKINRGDSTGLDNHLVLMPQDFSKTSTQTLAPDGKTTHYMNDTDTTAGGFAGSKLYKTYLPQIQTKLETDFGSNLMSFRTVISTDVDASGAPDEGAWYDAKVGIPNEVMIYGTILNGNNKNGSWYNIGDENSQLPLMRLNDAERNFYRHSFWLRDVHSASKFAYADQNGDDSFPYWDDASSTRSGVRAFFLIR